MKDWELTRLLQTHPEEGLEAAMLAYAPLVKAVLNRILPQNPCDREECMADVFVSLWRNAAKLERTATPLRPWLIVTARNKGIDRYNALRRRETVTLDDGLAETLGELAEFDRATADAVFALMMELARNHGTAFVLVTHDDALAARCGRALRLDRGRLDGA